MSGNKMNPAEHPLTPRIRTEVQVMFFDTDCAAVVHNISYLRFIETARTLLAEQLGMGLAEMARTQLFPVVARTEIDYKRPAVLGDKLYIDGWLESLDRTRFWCGFAVRRAADDALMVSSRQMLALVQMPAGRPVRLPADWSSRYAHLLAPTAAVRTGPLGG
jgi:YbgC/YbaW family acyl-CoA thioester hydrolase